MVVETASESVGWLALSAQDSLKRVDKTRAYKVAEKCVVECP